jgi:Arc/MetJ-type ribon-helix-helix transcriptional regulator
MARTKTKQANFSLPDDLLEELRRQVPKGEQSMVVAEALKKELLRMRFRRALDKSFGAWKQEDHPELEQGTEQFVRRLRHSSRTAEKRDQHVA